MRIRLVVDKLRRYYIHAITLDGLRERKNSFSLVHPTAYYTLNALPDGEQLRVADLTVKASVTPSPTGASAVAKPGRGATKKADSKRGLPVLVPPKTRRSEPLTYEIIRPLLQKHTCLACHHPDKRQVGPAYKDVTRRGYTVAEIVKLIYTPKPQNWPGYETPMPAMPQVPTADAQKIAEWINTLAK